MAQLEARRGRGGRWPAGRGGRGNSYYIDSVLHYEDDTGPLFYGF